MEGRRNGPPPLRGNNATGFIGGALKTGRRYPGGRGGNGGEKQSFGDGGLLFVRAENGFVGGGIVEVLGADGVDGDPGQTNPQGGGGGGGSSGHPGGAFVLTCLRNVEQPEVRKSGGSGGTGGARGQGTVSYGGGWRFHGDSGKDGNSGLPGRYVFIPGTWEP